MKRNIVILLVCAISSTIDSYAHAALLSPAEAVLRMEQYYDNMSIPETPMPDTTEAMQRWYNGIVKAQEDLRAFFPMTDEEGRRLEEQLSEDEKAKMSLLNWRICAAKAGFNPTKSFAAVVRNLTSDINRFERCNDDLGIGYCKFNAPDMMYVIEHSSKPLDYFFYSDEIQEVRQLFRLIRTYNARTGNWVEGPKTGGPSAPDNKNTGIKPVESNAPAKTPGARPTADVSNVIVDNQRGETDKLKLARILEKNRTGETTTWTNEKTRVTVTATPTKTYQSPTGQYCREYTVTVMKASLNTIRGTACRQADGAWLIVESQ